MSATFLSNVYKLFFFKFYPRFLRFLKFFFNFHLNVYYIYGLIEPPPRQGNSRTLNKNNQKRRHQVRCSSLRCTKCPGSQWGSEIQHPPDSAAGLMEGALRPGVGVEPIFGKVWLRRQWRSQKCELVGPRA